MKARSGHRIGTRDAREEGMPTGLSGHPHQRAAIPLGSAIRAMSYGEGAGVWSCCCPPHDERLRSPPSELA